MKNVKSFKKLTILNSYNFSDNNVKVTNSYNNSIVSSYCNMKIRDFMISDTNKLVIKSNKLLSGYEDLNELNFDNEIEDGTLYFRFKEY